MTIFGLGPALFFEDARTIEEVVQSAKQNKGLAYLVGLDASGRAAAEFNQVAAPNTKEASAAGSPRGYFALNEEMYHFSTPVVFEDKPVGRLMFGLSLHDAFRETAAYQGKLALLGLGLLLSALASIYAISFAITKPLRKVSEVAREVAQGDLAKRAPVMSADESGQLAVAFNTMVDALAESRANLEDRVERRTRELQAEVAERHRVEEALRTSEENLRSMVENLGEGVGLVSAEEVFLFANKTADMIFGVPKGGSSAAIWWTS